MVPKDDLQLRIADFKDSGCEEYSDLAESTTAT
jgi:hypothetical protein